MADFLSEEWFGAVLEHADPLPVVDGVTFSFDIEVAESAFGKVRGHGRVADGRLVSFQPGKFVPDEASAAPDVSFVAKAKRALPIITGDVNPLVAYMTGELKVDGAYELVVDHFARACDRDALENFRARIAADTD